jgi:hypothetical protein
MCNNSCYRVTTLNEMWKRIQNTYIKPENPVTGMHDVISKENDHINFTTLPSTVCLVILWRGTIAVITSYRTIPKVITFKDYQKDGRLGPHILQVLWRHSHGGTQTASRKSVRITAFQPRFVSSTSQIRNRSATRKQSQYVISRPI